MKKGLIILIILSILILILPPLIGNFINHKTLESLDVVEVNKLLSEIKNSDDMRITKESGKYSFDYTILNINEDVVYSSVDSDEAYATSIVMATKNRDTIRNIYKEQDQDIIGYLIIYNDLSVIERNIYKEITNLYAISYIAAALLWLVFGLFIYNKIIRPFDKMKDFAGAVARGDLDKPLEMDRDNVFGAFTESFDIMRDELSLAKKREYEANVSKRELIAQLSHDIKTPVASIKAMSEVLDIMAEKNKDLPTGKKAKLIGAKADQIDSLIGNLFSFTLEELEHLEVNAIETESSQLRTIIENADYDSRVVIAKICGCLIYVDKLRISQVISNIIYNSYKYAGTEIIVDSYLEGEYMYLSFSDTGGGVPEADLPFVTEKFRRGANAEGIEGSGLGLNIAKNLMQEMKGSLECNNTGEGFMVTLGFRLV
ncbi:MAG: HAMP domain-containing histidine kinase [Eubacterium sp.]|nr:HAMP domain-containing histidine kinase [Eubacterium sp.]